MWDGIRGDTVPWERPSSPSALIVARSFLIHHRLVFKFIDKSIGPVTVLAEQKEIYISDFLFASRLG
jgi:hypothetical protein